jgi:hypothetical protein
MSLRSRFPRRYAPVPIVPDVSIVQAVGRVEDLRFNVQSSMSPSSFLVFANVSKCHSEPCDRLRVNYGEKSRLLNSMAQSARGKGSPPERFALCACRFATYARLLSAEDFMKQLLILTDLVADIRIVHLEFEILREPWSGKSSARRLHAFSEVDALAVFGQQKVHE